MAYSPQTWHNEPTEDTPISAARLTVIESGIQAAAATADSASSTAGSTATTVAGLGAVYQPLDSDLTAIAALSTTSYGRALLALADAAAARTYIGASVGQTQSYLGKNAVGASTEAFAANRVYLKKITMASAGHMNSIEAHLKDGGGGQVASFQVALFADNAGAPGKVLFLGGGIHVNNSFVPDATAGWVGAPVGAYLSAADYWIAVDMTDNGSAVIYLDTSGGTDRYYDPGNVWIADSSLETVNTTVKDYSIRASILR